jgi:tRNA pseudouridine38-40 synthase
MPIIRLVLAYDGTDFHGWARQPRRRTVEGELTAFLEQVVQHPVRLSVAGRTDAGVHARGQVVSFESSANPRKLQRAVNGFLGPELVAVSASVAPQGFDARYSATAREYRYRIDTNVVADPFDARFVWHFPKELRLAAMREAAKAVVGTHEFDSFCRASPNATASTRRTLLRLSVARSGGRIEIAAEANGFLHQMVRVLVGTLVKAGEGKTDAREMRLILRARDRSRAAKAAPPHGLTLERVRYGGRR